MHRAFSEPLAVLAGDSLIVLAFEVLARAGGQAPDRALALTAALARLYTRKGLKPCHRPIVAAIAEIPLIAHFWLRPGKRMSRA